MSFLGALFGTSQGANIINSVTNAIDDVFYTEQEQSVDAAKARTEGYAVYLEWLKSTSGSRLARRLIAMMVTGTWFVQHSIAQILSLAALWTEDPTKLNEASELLFEYAQNNNALVGVVLLFYFGGPAGIDAAKGFLTKWVNKGTK